MYREANTLNFKDQTILIVAPHPDDEIFGCGGLISRCKTEGGKVYILYLTVGTTKDFSKRNSSTESERVKELKRVIEFLKIDGYKIAFPGDKYHLRLDALPQKDIIYQIESGDDISIEALKPTIILTPPSHDYNQDHRAAYAAAITATRPAPSTFKHLLPIVLSYEFPYFSWSHGNAPMLPQLFVALSDQDLNAKLKALKLYKSQLKTPDGPLSIQGVKTLASLRGMQSDVTNAEAFFIDRLLV